MAAEGSAESELPTPALVKQLAEQTTRLTRQEARLAQLELQEKAKRLSIGSGMLGAAGVLAAYGLAAILATCAAALTYVLPVWAAILVVAIAVFGVAGFLALLGRAGIRRAAPPRPEATVENVREDLHTVREGARR